MSRAGRHLDGLKKRDTSKQREKAPLLDIERQSDWHQDHGPILDSANTLCHSRLSEAEGNARLSGLEGLLWGSAPLPHTHGFRALERVLLE
jgi:hypothetical protein